MTLPVFIGYDSREQPAYDVACKTLRETASGPVDIAPLRLDALNEGGLLWRRTEHLKAGSLWDCVSRAPTSTEFSVSRFLIPQMQRKGWALFTDCDVVFLRDVADLFFLADDRYAVMVVKHQDLTSREIKMGRELQVPYTRKNWSSVVLWNCEHEANRRLDLQIINTWPRVLLHQFAWLKDEEIGEIPEEWNWLVNVEPRPPDPAIAHFTLGGPWLPGWKPAPNDDIWLAAAQGIYTAPSAE